MTSIGNRKAYLVNVMLDDCGPNHSHSARYESGGDFLQSAKIETSASEAGIKLQEIMRVRKRSQKSRYADNKVTSRDKDK